MLGAMLIYIVPTNYIDHGCFSHSQLNSLVHLSSFQAGVVEFQTQGFIHSTRPRQTAVGIFMWSGKPSGKPTENYGKWGFLVVEWGFMRFTLW